MPQNDHASDPAARTGTVVSIDPGAFSGVVDGDDGRRWFITRRTARSDQGSRPLQVLDRVRFVPGTDPCDQKGEIAWIALLEEPQDKGTPIPPANPLLRFFGSRRNLALTALGYGVLIAFALYLIFRP